MLEYPTNYTYEFECMINKLGRKSPSLFFFINFLPLYMNNKNQNLNANNSNWVDQNLMVIYLTKKTS